MPWERRLGAVIAHIEERIALPLQKKHKRKKVLRIVIDQCNEFADERTNGKLMKEFMNWADAHSNVNKINMRLIFVTSDGKVIPFIKSTFNKNENKNNLM